MIVRLSEKIAVFTADITPVIGPSVKSNTLLKKKKVIMNIRIKKRSEKNMALMLELILLN